MLLLLVISMECSQISIRKNLQKLAVYFFLNLKVWALTAPSFVRKS